jgi:hypothetical protein
VVERHHLFDIGCRPEGVVLHDQRLQRVQRLHVRGLARAFFGSDTKVGTGRAWKFVGVQYTVVFRC